MKDRRQKKRGKGSKDKRKSISIVYENKAWRQVFYDLFYNK